MKAKALKLSPTAYTPRYCRPELFGACQVRRTPPYAAA